MTCLQAHAVGTRLVPTACACGIYVKTKRVRRVRPEIRDLLVKLREQKYIADDHVATCLYLAITLKRPLLVEGESGVGKTEIAKVLANILDTNLIRLQCYEGLDVHTALYEWNYTKQLLAIRLYEHSAATDIPRLKDLFTEEFLLTRPLLEAIRQQGKGPVLLIDEIDRADEEFEALLLELLSDFQVSIPELGTVKASTRPAVVLTSNRTRLLSDALRRRCIYLWMDYPEFDKEVEIIRVKVPGINDALAHQIGIFMQHLRRLRLNKVPGVSESLDWALALMALHCDYLDSDTVRQTLGLILKDQFDLQRIGRDWIETILHDFIGVREEEHGSRWDHRDARGN